MYGSIFDKTNSGYGQIFFGCKFVCNKLSSYKYHALLDHNTMTWYDLPVVSVEVPTAKIKNYHSGAGGLIFFSDGNIGEPSYSDDVNKEYIKRLYVMNPLTKCCKRLPILVKKFGNKIGDHLLHIMVDESDPYHL